MKCDHCGRQVDGERLPRGWRRHGGSTWCQECWAKSWVPRSVTVPIAAPSAELWGRMRDGWQRSRRLANWTIDQLYAADVRPGPKDKIGKAPAVYLYGESTKRYPHAAEWAGAKNSANAILRMAESHYRRLRFDVLARGIATLPAFRGDAIPYLLDRDQWRLEIGKGGAMLARLSLPGGAVEVSLRGGAGFRRQITLLRRVIAGEIPAGEAKIIERRIGRFGTEEQSGRIMVSFSIYVPVASLETSNGGVFRLRTDADSFLIGLFVDDRRLWRLHADHVRQWVAAHRAMKQRMADDLKYENRWPAGVRKQFIANREARLAKQRNRLDSWVHEASAMVAGLAARRGIVAVEYNDADRGFIDSFPWFALKSQLESKLRERGVEFRYVADRKEADVWQEQSEWIEAAENTKGTEKLLRKIKRGAVQLARPASRRVAI